MNRPDWLILNDSQIRKMSTIAADIGMVTLASIVLPALFERFNAFHLVVGLPLTVAFWLLSLRLIR